MRLYSRHAEQMLYEKAKTISAQPQRWRCIYINFSAQHDPCSEGVRTTIVTNILKELLEDEDGHIYLCEDGDVFILFHGKVMHILNRLGEHFKEFGDTRHPEQTDNSLYAILDLDIHWTRFFELCEQKFNQLHAPRVVSERLPATPAYKPLRAPDDTLFRAAQTKRATRRRLVVLVVEDDPFTRRLVAGTLKADYDVIEAGDGSAAIAAYETSAPDAVFLDIELPDTNGHIILNKLLSFDKSAFIVMLSANSVKENILAALEKGAQGFATKPFAKEKLTHYLQLCATMRRSHQNIGVVDAR